MLIVLEGADGVGKTTLAQLLSQILDAEIIHSTAETPNDWDYFKGIMDEAKTRNIIADRFFWGQFVYQDRSERHLTFEQLHELESQLKSDGGKLIYVCAPEHIIRERLHARGEVTYRPVKALLMSYAYLLRGSNCPTIKYDTYTGKVDLFK